MNDSQKTILFPNNELESQLLEHYFIESIWEHVPTNLGGERNGIPLGWTSILTSTSEEEKARQCISFMNHIASEYNENVICFQYPRRFPVPDKHQRVQYCYIESLSTYPLPQHRSIIVIYDNTAFSQYSVGMRISMLNRLHPHIIYYLD